ncbi:MAG: DNA replication/repair protein RecF [Actinobacteria bacterium]|nr:MAG: DNA replication/repair protein RecF [Actinomycetota bacterium]
MYVARLGLRDFRSYASADVELGPGVTLLIGRNGHGKTNLVEALVYAARQSSHRVAKDAPLIRAGTDQAIISVRVRWQDREQTVELELNAGRPKRARVAGAPRRPREALGVLRAVVFAPEDLALVKGDPAVRRAFLDDLVVALTPRMAGVLADFERIVRQRSTLLKSLAGTWRRDDSFRATLDIWDEQLVRVGSEVASARLRALELLRDPLRAAYAAVAPHGGEAWAGYESSWLDGANEHVGAIEDLQPALRQALADRQRAELERGLTLVGPQRDDLALAIGDLPAKGYASHGESWSLALSLRLATFELLRSSFDTAGGDPVLILDDVFAELDSERRQRLAERVVDAEQVIVTAAVAEDVPLILSGGSLSVTRDGVSRVVA